MLPTLETERLTLRPLAPSDAPSIQQAASAREIADTMISIPHPYPDGEAERYIARQRAQLEEGTAVTFVMEQKPEHRFSGVIEIRGIDREHAQAEISFWLAPEAWGRGFTSEALRAVLRYGFGERSLNRMYAYHMMRNASLRARAGKERIPARRHTSPACAEVGRLRRCGAVGHPA